MDSYKLCISQFSAFFFSVPAELVVGLLCLKFSLKHQKYFTEYGVSIFPFPLSHLIDKNQVVKSNACITCIRWFGSLVCGTRENPLATWQERVSKAECVFVIANPVGISLKRLSFHRFYCNLFCF